MIHPAIHPGAVAVVTGGAPGIGLAAAAASVAKASPDGEAAVLAREFDDRRALEASAAFVKGP